MSLVAAYNKICSNLEAQVQGTCGLYSFYNAVCILRELDKKNPEVPSPKKSKALPGSKFATESLRQYSKRALKSGQGEILTELEMTTLVKAWGYKAETSSGKEPKALEEFIEKHTKANHPVLVPYLADDDIGTRGLKPVIGGTADPGAHWSVILAISGKNVEAVEPNRPKASITWALDTLLKSNAMTDTVKFKRHYAKVVNQKAAYDRQLLDKGKKGPKVPTWTGVAPVEETDKATWTPTWGGRSGQTRLYDLGGTTTTRQDDMKLNYVLVAVIPP